MDIALFGKDLTNEEKKAISALIAYGEECGSEAYQSLLESLSQTLMSDDREDTAMTVMQAINEAKKLAAKI